MSWVVHPRSRFWLFMDAGSRGHISNGSHIPDPQNWLPLCIEWPEQLRVYFPDERLCKLLKRGTDRPPPPLVLLSLYTKLNVYNHLKRESEVNNFCKRMKIVKIAMALECFTSWSAVSLSYTWGAGSHRWCNGLWVREHSPRGGTLAPGLGEQQQERLKQLQLYAAHAR
jgi:hypothetical protein